jgi:hypothetical protein
LEHATTKTTPASAVYFSGRPASRNAPPHLDADEPTSPRRITAPSTPRIGADEEEKRRDPSKSVGDTERDASKGSYISMWGVDFHDMTKRNRMKRRPSSNRTLRAIENAMASHWTEFIAAFLIILNVVFMVLEGQYRGAKIGYDLGVYSHYGSGAFLEETGAPSERAFYVADVIFAVLFTIELLLRLVFLRSEFVCDPWGWLDISVVVVTDVMLIASTTISVNVSAARAVRLARLLRIIRLARQITLFDSLYLMTTALKGSVSVLLWVVVFLFVVQTLFALLVANIVQDYYLSSGGEEFFKTDADKEEVFRYFGTYWRAMVSLFELMLANWPPICRLMMDTMHEPWSVFALCYKLVMGFAVIGVIFGVFTQETFRAAETDDMLLLKRKANQNKLHAMKMKNLFQMMEGEGNEDMSGGIDVQQFKRVLKHPEFQLWLKAMDYDTSDAELLFYLIDTDGDGTLTIDELIKGMAMLKGTARNIDVKVLMRQSIIGRMQHATPTDRFGKRLSATAALKRIISESSMDAPKTADGRPTADN